MLDWQTVVVALIVAAALLYTARRAIARLRAFTPGGRGSAPSCASGCGKCGDEGTRTAVTRDALVRISSSRTPTNRGAR